MFLWFSVVSAPSKWFGVYGGFRSMVTSMVGLSVWCLWVWKASTTKYGYKYGWVIGLVFMGMEGSANELIVKQRGAPTTQTGTLQRSSAEPR